MTAATIILGAGGDQVGAVAAAIGQWCQRWPEKVLARDFGVAIQTAKKWRRGVEMPAGRHLVAMANRWGQPFIDQVFKDVIDDITLDRRMEALEASFALIRQDLCHAATDRVCQASGPADRLGAPEGGRMARSTRSPLATARALIVGMVLGATLLQLVPHMPRSVADLMADVGADVTDGLKPKSVRAVRTAAARTTTRL